MELLANLLYLYDTSWSLEQEGARVVVGHAYHVVQQLPEDMKKPAIVRKIRKWLSLCELGHLLGEGPHIVEQKKFGRSVLVENLFVRQKFPKAFYNQHSHCPLSAAFPQPLSTNLELTMLFISIFPTFSFSSGW